MNIAIFSDTFPPLIDGVANMAYRSAQALVDDGHIVKIFTVADAGHENNDDIWKGFSVVVIPSIPAGAYRGHRLALPSARWFLELKKFKPDIIHSHTPFGVGWAAVLASKILKIPLIATHHTFYDHYLKHLKLDYFWMKRFSWRYTIAYYNRCDLVISPSQSLADAMIVKGLKRPIKVLENFIDTDLFCPPANPKQKEREKNNLGIKGVSIVYMGRLSYEKNIEDVVAAFSKALRYRPDLTLVLIGDGPQRDILASLAGQLHITEHIIFTGFLEGLPLVRALQANDIFITASRSENMPLSVLEAMAVGLPVITVKEKGLGELIKSNVNGWFAKTGDHEDMGKKIAELSEDQNLRKKFALGSRSLALVYGKSTVMKKLEGLYEGLISASEK